MSMAEADVALGNLYNSPMNFQIMDLSISYEAECLTFITPEFLADNSWKTLISPFSPGMWLGVLISLALAGIVFFTLSNVYEYIVDTATELNKKDFFDPLSSCILYTYSMILLVSLPRLPVRWSVRVLTGWYWIYCVLVVVAYRAALTSILANPQPRLTIDTLGVLAKSNLISGASGEHNLNLFSQSIDEDAQKIGLKIENVNSTSDVVCT
jgi:high-affinity Fe2+/Pb2+ permease